MTLRPMFSRVLTSALTLSRGGPIVPRLMAFVPTRSNSDSSSSSSSPNSPFLPQTRSQPPSTTPSLGLSSFLGDSLLSRTRPAPSDPTTTDDLLSAEFPVFSGTGTTFGGTNVMQEDDMHRLCVFATKHNTHISLTKPSKDPLLVLSCGNVGFKKAARGTFEAGYQLASVMFQRMEERGFRPKNLEIVYRDFGPGREAFTKVLLGKEGKVIRGTVRRVTDATRLKFGGTRSRAARRL